MPPRGICGCAADVTPSPSRPDGVEERRGVATAGVCDERRAPRRGGEGRRRSARHCAPRRGRPRRGRGRSDPAPRTPPADASRLPRLDGDVVARRVSREERQGVVATSPLRRRSRHVSPRRATEARARSRARGCERPSTGSVARCSREREAARPLLGPVRQELVVIEALLVDQRLGVRRAFELDPDCADRDLLDDGAGHRDRTGSDAGDPPVGGRGREAPLVQIGHDRSVRPPGHPNPPPAADPNCDRYRDV